MRRKVVKTLAGIPKLWLAAGLLLVFGMNSCTWNKVEDFPCSPVTATFQADVVPILERACTDPAFGVCHQAGSSARDYTTYAGVLTEVINGKFQSRVIDQRNMPPDFSNGPINLSLCEIEKLQKWLDEGAQNN